MARIAWVVAPGLPHHITQRGNRRQTTFFRDDDYEAYLDLMADWCGKCGVEVWSYCLMLNHVCLIAVPSDEGAFRRAIGEAHRRYTRMVSFRENRRGCLWQGRFASFCLDSAWLRAAARYVALNPVRARLVRRPEKYLWSSTAAHLGLREDRLVRLIGNEYCVPNGAKISVGPGFPQAKARKSEYSRLFRVQALACHSNRSHRFGSSLS